jgi:hypothetical protein
VDLVSLQVRVGAWLDKEALDPLPNDTDPCMSVNDILMVKGPIDPSM